jgi:acetone carboxylase gamma subunit
MEYTCDLCNYNTDRAYDLKVHNLTKKHLKRSGLYELGKLNNNKEKNKNEDKIHVIEDKNPHNTEIIINNNKKENKMELDQEKTNKCVCGKKYSSYKNLWRHKQTCNVVNNNLVVLEKTEIDTLKQSNKELIAEVNDLKSIIKSTLKPQTPINIDINTTNNNNTTNNTLNGNVNTMNNNMNMLSAVKYINKNYNIAQPLEMLESSHAKNMLTAKTTKDHTVEEFMIYHYNKSLFDYFIGEIIKSEYKKDNPKIQQFWATDVSRLSFVVRQAIEKSDKIWINDKKGVLLKKYIITPILTEVKLMVDKYFKYCKNQIKENGEYLNLDTIEKLMDFSITCEKISIDIGNEVLHDLVLKYITPYFQLEI